MPETVPDPIELDTDDLVLLRGVTTTLKRVIKDWEVLSGITRVEFVTEDDFHFTAIREGDEFHIVLSSL